MTPNSFAYIVFLVIGALIYHPLSQKAKKPFLLLLSIWFYAIGGVKFLPLLALTVAFNFFAMLYSSQESWQMCSNSKSPYTGLQ